MSTRAAMFFFLLITALLSGYFGSPFFLENSDKRRHLPGDTSHGHYQIEMACKQCHAPFKGVSNDACLKCHEAELKAMDDSHPDSKFTDPRNATRVAGLDARSCITCHREHVPERTRAGGVTLPRDFCFKCHSDVADDRPSHKGIDFTRCSEAGCHNYHDNRALYEDLYKKHFHEPDILASAAVAARTPPPPKNPPARVLTAKDADAPPGAPPPPKTVADWEASAHARGGVNCTGCHEVRDQATGATRWEDRPGHAACGTCHTDEDAGFLGGRHGMRLAAGMSPMTPGMARQPMKPDARQREVGCGSCHDAHAADTAAVDGCLRCHDDKHSLAFKTSRHFRLWEAEQAQQAPKNTGVSCATCHLPRQVHGQGASAVTRVQHNQNDNLRPNDKMVRSVCLSCHGFGFSIDALADADLILRNFNGRPGKHVESLGMAERRMSEKKEGVPR